MDAAAAGSSSSAVSRDRCQCGTVGGKASPADGPGPGAGNTSGCADDDRLAPPKEGRHDGRRQGLQRQWRLWMCGRPHRSALYDGRHDVRGATTAPTTAATGSRPTTPAVRVCPQASHPPPAAAEPVRPSPCAPHRMDQYVPGAGGGITIEYNTRWHPRYRPSMAPSPTPSPLAIAFTVALDHALRIASTADASGGPGVAHQRQTIDGARRRERGFAPVSGHDQGKRTAARSSNGKHTFRSYANRYVPAESGRLGAFRRHVGRLA
ncbi:hypothetical protein pneo_cds_735 [Pandoravirus neocaledonia]|uniref:Uncharacterized protein n=1 Tax=Pandoravirus neocaledonia TaxID=2107708 RepID=A0A2U7UD63_9VIRU|nr:hypothetical protein pneo_cds_735 [Pandoravirus neocaledonia]AVK76342.1 hypothetical protein pneo_cds_735 [Pandoravirus neocaledonia]